MPWVITDDNAGFWNSEQGFVDRQANATIFTDEEKEACRLPISGAWFKLPELIVDPWPYYEGDAAYVFASWQGARHTSYGVLKSAHKFIPYAMTSAGEEGLIILSEYATPHMSLAIRIATYLQSENEETHRGYGDDFRSIFDNDRADLVESVCAWASSQDLPFMEDN